MKIRLSRRAWPYIFLAPYIVVLSLFLILPIVYAAKLSLFSDSMFGPARYIGFRNYARAITDERFWAGVWNTLQFGLLHMPVMFGLAILLAMTIDGGRIWGKSAARLLIFLPYAVPTLIAGMIWSFIYGPKYGLVGSLNNVLPNALPNMLSADWILVSMSNIAIWEYTGYVMIVLLGALNAVPRDLPEAARMDGANAWQIIRFVKLPGIRGTLQVMFIFSIIGTLQLFNEPQIMRSVAPGVIDGSFTPNMHAYTVAFSGQQLSYSAAISFLLAVVIAVASVVYAYLSGGRK